MAKQKQGAAPSQTQTQPQPQNSWLWNLAYLWLQYEYSPNGRPNAPESPAAVEGFRQWNELKKSLSSQQIAELNAYISGTDPAWLDVVQGATGNRNVFLAPNSAPASPAAPAAPAAPATTASSSPAPAAQASDKRFKALFNAEMKDFVLVEIPNAPENAVKKSVLVKYFSGQDLTPQESAWVAQSASTDYDVARTLEYFNALVEANAEGVLKYNVANNSDQIAAPDAASLLSYASSRTGIQPAAVPAPAVGGVVRVAPAPAAPAPAAAAPVAPAPAVAAAPAAPAPAAPAPAVSAAPAAPAPAAPAPQTVGSVPQNVPPPPPPPPPPSPLEMARAAFRANPTASGKNKSDGSPMTAENVQQRLAKARADAEINVLFASATPDEIQNFIAATKFVNTGVEPEDPQMLTRMLEYVESANPLWTKYVERNYGTPYQFMNSRFIPKPTPPSREGEDRMESAPDEFGLNKLDWGFYGNLDFLPPGYVATPPSREGEDQLKNAWEDFVVTPPSREGEDRLILAQENYIPYSASQSSSGVPANQYWNAVLSSNSLAAPAAPAQVVQQKPFQELQSPQYALSYGPGASLPPASLQDYPPYATHWDAYSTSWSHHQNPKPYTGVGPTGPYDDWIRAWKDDPTVSEWYIELSDNRTKMPPVTEFQKLKDYTPDYKGRATNPSMGQYRNSRNDPSYAEEINRDAVSVMPEPVDPNISSLPASLRQYPPYGTYWDVSAAPAASANQYWNAVSSSNYPAAPAAPAAPAQVVQQKPFQELQSPQYALSYGPGASLPPVSLQEYPPYGTHWKNNGEAAQQQKSFQELQSPQYALSYGPGASLPPASLQQYPPYGTYWVNNGEAAQWSNGPTYFDRGTKPGGASDELRAWRSDPEYAGTLNNDREEMRPVDKELQRFRDYAPDYKGRATNPSMGQYLKSRNDPSYAEEINRDAVPVMPEPMRVEWGADYRRRPARWGGY